MQRDRRVNAALPVQAVRSTARRSVELVGAGFTHPPAAMKTRRHAEPVARWDRRPHARDLWPVAKPADYVLFGEPDARGQRPSVEAIAERLQWWAELFEPPCVGFAVSRDEAAEFAAAGADFILVGDFIWADPRGAEAALIEVEQAIRQAHAATSDKSRENAKGTAKGNATTEQG